MIDVFDVYDEGIDLRFKDGRDFSYGYVFVGYDYQNLCKFIMENYKIVRYICFYSLFFKLFVTKIVKLYILKINMNIEL